MSHGSDRRSFDPLEFLATLMPHIPGTHEKTILYYGHTSNRSRGLRKKAEGAARVGPPPEIPASDLDDEEPPSPARSHWARLIRKVYETDPLVCPKCRGVMRVISFITDEEVVFRILTHLDLFEPDPPPRPPPRGDPDDKVLAEVPTGDRFDFDEAAFDEFVS